MKFDRQTINGIGNDEQGVQRFHLGDDAERADCFSTIAQKLGAIIPAQRGLVLI